MADPEIAGVLAALMRPILRDVLRDELPEALAEAVADMPQHEELVDIDGAAKLLRVSASTVRRLRAAGMPTIMVAQSPRWSPSAIVEWCRKQGTP